jgi:putative hydrolase of the HAD superfamily
VIPEPTIRHLLFDADGVIQDLDAAWRSVLADHLGDRVEGFLDTVWAQESSVLAGSADHFSLLTEILHLFGVEASAEALYMRALELLVPFEDSLRMLEACRAAGYSIHLATNQDHYSGPYMARVLGYDDLFDVSCYSYELRVAKPDAKFFLEAVRRIGADAGDILFVDDNPVNVEAAAAVGLRATHWSHGEGIPLLSHKLTEQGVHVEFG